MRFIVFLLLSIGISSSLFAQQTNLYVGSENRPIRITTGTVYQQYADEDRQLSQVAFPISVFVPVVRNLGFSVMTTPVLIEADADSLASVSGINDTQAALSYFQNIGAGSVVLSMTANLPSGKKELTVEEFNTMALVSQDFYNFGVSVLGQGFNLSPGLTIAYPVNDNVAIGIGASYQMKGGFKPVLNTDSTFTPGDELLITGGVDVRVGRAWALSSNVSYITYQEDLSGNTSIFESGDQVFVSMQLLGNIGTNQLRLLARYRSKAKSLLPVGNNVATAPRTVPEQIHFAGTYRIQIQDGLQATILGRVGHYNETDFFSAKTRFDVGAVQQYAFTEVIGANFRFIYTFGSFPGVEVGGGLVVTL